MWITVGVSIAGYLLAYRLIPILKPYLEKAGMVGKDLNKLEKYPVPESCGLGPAIVFLLMALVASFDVLPSQLAQFNAGLFSIAFGLLLGFVDDVLDIPWRFKIVLPFFASLPLLISYSGSTYIVLPFRLGVIHLGLLYHMYMAMVLVFCTNSINILAGINGLEVAQSIVIGMAVLVHLVYEGFLSTDFGRPIFALILPFLAVSFALFQYNKYPSKVFVGDTYTLFAGMVLGSAGISGHFSKTLMLFFIPQVLNFLYSLPQLLGFLPCARHRLPIVRKDGLLEGDARHWNLVNLTLRVLGPMREDQLCFSIVAFQCLCCALGLLVRHYGAHLVFY